MPQEPLGLNDKSTQTMFLIGCGCLFVVVVAIAALAASIFAGVNGGGDTEEATTETRVNTFQVGESPALVVKIGQGRVVIVAGPPEAIEVKAILPEGKTAGYQAQQDGDTVTISARRESCMDYSSGPRADVEITVPTATSLDVGTTSGRIEVDGIHGPAKLETCSGSILVESVVGSLKIGTSDGLIDIRDMEGDATLRTTSGPMTIRQARGSFQIRAYGGSVDFTGEMIPGGSNRIQTSHGDVVVQLEGTPSLDLDVSTSTGIIDVYLPIDATGPDDEHHMVGIIGDGDSELAVKTTGGDVIIK